MSKHTATDPELDELPALAVCDVRAELARLDAMSREARLEVSWGRHEAAVAAVEDTPAA